MRRYFNIRDCEFIVDFAKTRPHTLFSFEDLKMKFKKPRRVLQRYLNVLLSFGIIEKLGSVSQLSVKAKAKFRQLGLTFKDQRTLWYCLTPDWEETYFDIASVYFSIKKVSHGNCFTNEVKRGF